MEECLGVYRDTPEKLYTICKNTTNSGPLKGAVPNYYIKKIVIEFENNFDKVMDKLETPNDEFDGKMIKEIKLYILGCEQSEIIRSKVENILINWGIYYRGKGILTSLHCKLVERFRYDFIKNNYYNIKYKNEYSLHINVVLFLFDIYNGNEDIGIIIHRFKNQVGEASANKIINYLVGKNVVECKSNNRKIFITVNEQYIKIITEEGNLLKEIEELYGEMLNLDYKDIIRKLYLVQQNSSTWISIDKLDKFIDYKDIKLLKQNKLLEEVLVDSVRLIRLTEVSISICNGNFIDRWFAGKYYMEDKSKYIIAHNDNPIKIVNLLADNKFRLKEREFLLIFERIG